ncbi:MAG: NAD(P)H-dependent oxidoreductase [Actinobacteria bacterium]|nr:NAD(P)H-dependent oxidoreductase [Actinomycetota bacterium]
MRILALGGSTRTESSGGEALRIAAEGAQVAGAQVEILRGRSLIFPLYDAETAERDDAVRAMVEAVRRADGLIVVSPGYHGGISGLVKNALDYIEDLRGDSRPYLEGRAVGCVAVAHGWQAAITTLQQIRQVVHALRGWPTPFGAAINGSVVRLSDLTADDPITQQLHLVGQQVVEFARMRRAHGGAS